MLSKILIEQNCWIMDFLRLYKMKMNMFSRCTMGKTHKKKEHFFYKYPDHLFDGICEIKNPFFSVLSQIIQTFSFVNFFCYSSFISLILFMILFSKSHIWINHLASQKYVCFDFSELQSQLSFSFSITDRIYLVWKFKKKYFIKQKNILWYLSELTSCAFKNA